MLLRSGLRARPHFQLFLNPFIFGSYGSDRKSAMLEHCLPLSACRRIRGSGFGPPSFDFGATSGGHVLCAVIRRYASLCAFMRRVFGNSNFFAEGSEGNEGTEMKY